MRTAWSTSRVMECFLEEVMSKQGAEGYAKARHMKEEKDNERRFHSFNKQVLSACYVLGVILKLRVRY